MNKLVLNFALLAALSAGLSAHAQKKKEVINDSNTPLHLLQPDYQVGYADAHRSQGWKEQLQEPSCW